MAKEKTVRMAVMQFRAAKLERETLEEAAQVAGIGVGTWMRERLLRAAVRELEEVGRVAAFLKQP